jgi:hypothetical protein
MRYSSSDPYPARGSGHLGIEICDCSSREGRTFKWADRKSWTLDDKLPEVLQDIEIRAAEDEHRRLEAERAAVERRRRWEVAMAQAKAALVEAGRVEQLHKQAKQWRQAQQLREYVAAMKDTIDTLIDSGEVLSAQERLVWARTYLASFDPLARRMAIPEPPKATAEALKPFLDGWSPFGP